MTKTKAFHLALVVVVAALVELVVGHYLDWWWLPVMIGWTVGGLGLQLHLWLTDPKLPPFQIGMWGGSICHDGTPVLGVRCTACGTTEGHLHESALPLVDDDQMLAVRCSTCSATAHIPADQVRAAFAELHARTR